MTLTMLLVGCGNAANIDSEPVVTSNPIGDAAIDVSGDPDSDLCFSASIARFDVDFERRCYPPPHAQILTVAAGALVESDDPGVNSATLLVTPYPIVVTDVQQDGETISWLQDGGGLLVLGLSLVAAPTTVEFELGDEQGVCEFRPDGESCRIS
jgi:hypothetical protein